MSKDNQPEVLYQMPNGELINASYEHEPCFIRDLSDLKSRGIDATRVDELIQKRINFQNVPTDDTMTALISVEIKARDADVEILTNNMQEIVGIARNGLGAKSPEFATFGNVEFSRMDVPALCTASMTIAQRANVYLAKLGIKGITKTMIDDLDKQKKSVEAGIINVSKAEANQKLTTSIRRNKGNELYLELKDMSTSARVYYEKRDPLKADDYVLYDLPDDVQMRNGEVKPTQIVTRELKGVNTKSVFRLQVKVGDTLTFYYSKKENGVAGLKKVTVNSNPGNYDDHTPVDLGFDPENGYIHFCIENPSTTEVANYRVQVVG